MKTVHKNNIAVIEYNYENITPSKVRINYLKMKYLGGRERKFDNLDDFIQWCTNDRVALVFVYDFKFFGGFLDYWAFTKNIPQYDPDSTERAANGISIAQDCWSALYTGAGMLNFKITLQRTQSTHRQGLRKGSKSYHTTEFRGLAPYYGGLKLTEVRRALRLENAEKCDLLINLIEYAQHAYKAIAEVDFLSPHFMRSTYTVGRAARSLYLRIRYGKDSLTAYQKEHPQEEELEDFFRLRKLLLGGMCIINNKCRGRLFLRKPPQSIKKYDVNGLYSFIANECGELAPPEMSTVDEYYSDTSGEYVYILVLRSLLAYRKVGVTNVFTDPFSGTDDDIIEFNTEYAIFGELYAELDNFYDIEEGRIIRVYKCKKIPDPAIIEYNTRLVKFKDKGREEDNRALYVIAKIFLNALIGKFLQATKSTEIIAQYDSNDDIVRLTYGKSINNWERGHFDFIRGAYIYTMARVKVMKDLRRVFSKYKMIARHWYTDTDSIVTDIDFPPDMLSQTELGKYKIEAAYNAFGVISKKVYYGRTTDGEDKLTAAGIPKEEVIKALAAAFPDGLTPLQYFEFLNTGEEIELPTRMRMSGGCGVVLSKYTFNNSLPLEFL